LKVAGLFAGIGGLERGLAATGHETCLTCEIWEPARAVLKAHMPDVPCEFDVRQLASLPDEVELLVGGFPCQDLSQAGQTLGIGGMRSGLVGEVFRLLDNRPVPWVVLENVSFMLQLHKGSAMRTLIEEFEERGYNWAYRVINTLSFLPQRRERVFFVATRSQIDPASVLFVDEAQPVQLDTNLSERGHGFYWTEGLRGLGWAIDAIPTLKNGSTVGIPSPPAIILPSGQVITPDIRDAERLQGFPEDWTKPAEEIARSSQRWSLIGNAVSVPVAQWLGERLAAPGLYDHRRDQAMDSAGRLPRAARGNARGQRFCVEINSFPVWNERPTLTSFLRYEGKLLSARATRGFLSRTERAKLRFPVGFQDRLRNHLRFMEESPVLDPQSYAVAAE
jgi:DNA (cytosine-5)-methyltransferase 1